MSDAYPVTLVYFRNKEGVLERVSHNEVDIDLDFVKDQKQAAKDIKALGLTLAARTPVLCLLTNW